VGVQQIAHTLQSHRSLGTPPIYESARQLNTAALGVAANKPETAEIL